MIDTSTRTPEQWRAWSTAHQLVALLLAIVLVLLWLSGHGPDSTQCCDAPTAGVPVAAPVGSAPVAAPAPAPQTPAAIAPLPSARIFFAVDKSVAFTPDSDSLNPVIAYLKDHGGATVVLSGYHDPSGDPVRNATLARKRANSVRFALSAAGIGDARIVLEKPRDATGSGSSAAARRVDVSIQP